MASVASQGKASKIYSIPPMKDFMVGKMHRMRSQRIIMQFLGNQESNLIVNTLLNRMLFQAREDHTITQAPWITGSRTSAGEKGCVCYSNHSRNYMMAKIFWNTYRPARGISRSCHGLIDEMPDHGPRSGGPNQAHDWHVTNSLSTSVGSFHDHFCGLIKFNKILANTVIPR